MKVLKFGGKCLADREMIERVVSLIARETPSKIVVVSAIAGVTDQLLDFISTQRSEEDIDKFVARLKSQHISLLPQGDLQERSKALISEKCTKLERLLYGITYTEELTSRTKDLILSFGERFSAHVLVANLSSQKVGAVALESDAIGLVTDEVYGNATALLDECKQRMRPFLLAHIDKGIVPVITGYFGATIDGHVTTFGRGGSDYSAAVVANAMDAPLIEIWKEVDGFMSADPKMVPRAFQLAKLSYDEAAELAYFGAKVLHPRTVYPARLCNAQIFIGNIFKLGEQGTRIGPDTVERKDIIKSVSYMRDIATLKVYGSGAGYKQGILSEITDRLSQANVNVYSATTSQTCIALLIEKSDILKAMKALAPTTGGIMEKAEVLPDVALICAVGEGLGYTKGVAARVFRAVASVGVNVQLISSGASMVAYHFTVADEDLEKSIKAIHREFFGNGL